MCPHENKNCPRCNQVFECRAGNVLQCMCYGISFTAEEIAFMEKAYADCLCMDCLQELKRYFSLSPKQVSLKKIE